MMKFFAIRWWSVVLGVTIFSVVPAQAATSGTATAVITTTYTLPPCDIDAPSTVNFGHVNLGDIVPLNFNIKIKCPAGTPVATSVKMSPATGYSATTTGNITMNVAGTSTPSGAILRLFYNSVQIRPYASASDLFCAGTASGDRICTLRAELDASSPGISPGGMDAIVVFDVELT
ncbi:Csu type fimbrial protein [Escherichia coli]|nr:type 1 fimbrial protein [Escherichia coli]